MVWGTGKRQKGESDMKDTRTIDFAMLTKVSDALYADPDTVELGMEFSQAIIDATPKPCLADITQTPCTNEATATVDGVPACDECCGELVEDRRATLADCAERGADDTGGW